MLLAIASFFLFAVIILAPGNFARMGSNGEYVNQPFLFCSFKSFAILVHLLASESFAWFNELLVVSAGLILFFFIQKNTKGIMDGACAGMCAVCFPLSGFSKSTALAVEIQFVVAPAPTTGSSLRGIFLNPI